MELETATDALSALAQESRLKVFRLLVRAGANGMAAGDIARTLGIPHNTLSSHLAILARSKLVTSRKQARSIIYAVDLEGRRVALAKVAVIDGPHMLAGPTLAGGFRA